MKQSRVSKWWFVLAVAVVLVATLFGVRYYNESKADPDGTDSAAETGDSGSDPALSAPGFAPGRSYFDYLAEYRDAPSPDVAIVIDVADFLSDDGADVGVSSYRGREDVLVWDSEAGEVTWGFDVAQAGFYSLVLDYCPVTVKGNEVQLGVKLDGAFPYPNAETFTLPRQFIDETYKSLSDNAFGKDSLGNDIRPYPVEQYEWREYVAEDNAGQYTGAMKFYLSAGSHTVTLRVTMEGMALSSMRFANLPDMIDYAAYLAENAEKDDKKAPAPLSSYYEAEKSYLKSHNILFPTFDKSSVAVQPSSAVHTLYNTIGSNTWNKQGQEIAWEVEAPADGWYCFSFKVKQNMKRGMYSVREMRIDGQSLFAEMSDIKFGFENAWYMADFADENGEPYRIWLTEGVHVMSLRASAGDLSDMLRRVDLAVEAMNYWYREIIKITGTNADAARITIDSNRDFLLDRKIPGLLEGFDEIADLLESVVADIDRAPDMAASSASVLSETVTILRQLIKKPGRIANRIETFRGNMSAVATWAVDTRDQPLEMDYFAMYTPDAAKPRLKSHFFEQIAYRASMFVDSFVTDQNALGSNGGGSGEPLNVWISTADMAGTGGIASGRDQAMLLKRIIDDTFTPSTGINVQISLVNSSSTLTQAVLAGKGPDVALFVTKDTPVNLAMRGALYPLSDFSDFGTVAEQFYPSALIPYVYRDTYYALPETQSFDMLFYRTDIFEQLGLVPPETWKDFYSLIPMLMESNFQVGIPESQRTFEMLLYQNGGSFYDSSLSKTAFDTPQALHAFEQWTGLYAKYSLPLIFDFFNRFRTGEMPMAIMPYTQVNYLTVAAPEIKNLWDFAPVPGTVDENGNISRTETANGTASIMLADTDQPESAYTFLKWWVSAETQARFGVELEQNLGPSARYPTANVAAFDHLPWTKQQAANLATQWADVTDVPQIPGNYYISRNISFAFRAVVYKAANERESLYKYNKEINEEIERKLKEFELAR